MPTFQSSDLTPNQEITSNEPQLSITVSNTDPLPVGAYEFQLVVADDSGNASKPATVRIIVADDQAPTAVIDAPSQVGFGKSFTLSGARSIDIGGTITKYTWTLTKTP